MSLRSYFVLVGFFGMLIFSCDVDKVDGPIPPPFPDEARQAATLLLSNIAVSDSAEIFVVGPVATGTVLQERVADTTLPVVTLTVPDSTGAKYVFYINDHPELGFSHDVRYAWVDLSCNCVNVLPAFWSPILIQPGIEPSPFYLLASERINGKSFNYGTGGGLGVERNTDHKQEVILPPGPVLDDPPCRKIGLVMDFGESDDSWGKGDGTSADNLAENAGFVQSFLESNGFTVQRTSQYSGNSYPAFFPSSGNADAMGDGLRNLILGYAGQLACPCDGLNGCHEFFLYINAHGNQGYVELHEPGGKGGVTGIRYADLNTWLNSFLPCVKIIVFLDACHSGAAIQRLQGQCNLRADCGFTIFTTCSEDEGTPTGEGVTDSGSEDWSEGTDDQDGDGKDGDLGDRWLNLEDENSSYDPQRYMCPNQQSMCSTD